MGWLNLILLPLTQFNTLAHDSILGLCLESEQWSAFTSCRPWDLRLLPCHREGRSLSGTVPTTSKRGDSLSTAQRDTRLPRSNCWHAAPQVLQGSCPSPAALHLGSPWMCSGGLLGTVLGRAASSHCAQSPSCAAHPWAPSPPDSSVASPLTPTLHHLLHPHAAQRHREISGAQADAWTSPQLRDAQICPQSGIRPNPGFLSPNMLQLPTEGRQRLR